MTQPVITHREDPKEFEIAYSKLMEDSFEKDDTLSIQKEAENPKNIPEDEFVTAKDLIELGITEIPRLWDPFINEIGIAALVGASDCGKSILLRQLSIAIVNRDKEFLGFPLNVRHGAALYIVTEDNPFSIASALKKEVQQKKLDNYIKLKFRFENDEETYTVIEKELEKNRVDLVVIDAWADIFEGSTNSVKDVRMDMKRLKRICSKFHVAIILLHHLVKTADKSDPNKNKVNGSQSFEASLRTVLELRYLADSKESFLSVLKGNNISKEQKSKSLKIILDEERLLFTTENEIVDLTEIGSGQRKRKYDNQLIRVALFQKRREGISFQESRKQLVDQFGEDNVPKLTQLKNMEKALDGQSVKTPSSEPTDQVQSDL